MVGLPEEITMTFYINLDSRKDRNKEILQEFKNVGLTRFTRISATSHNFGCVGCTMSHIAVCKKILNDYPDLYNKYFLILEDDFTFYTDAGRLNNIHRLFTDNIDFNVVLFAANVKKKSASDFDFLEKCDDAQTTAGYFVIGEYVPTLLRNFEEGLPLLIENMRLKQPPNSAIDMHWKRLQGDKWYLFNPLIGYQRPSYSDINKRFKFPKK